MKEMVYKNYMENGQEVIEILDEGIYKGFHYAIVSYGTNPCAYVEIPGDISCMMLGTKMNLIILIVMAVLLMFLK